MAPRKRKPTKKISPPKDVKESVIETLPFHITFPITLTHKDGKNIKNCYFQVKEHCDKYIKRLNLKPKDYTVKETEPRISNGES